jgi:dihydropyrimidine dehydrogenase (NAD+) subunit PreA
MSERGMGSAVGQVPDYTRMITEWVKEVATVPVMVKLSPNVTDVTSIGRAAVQGGADAISLINTVNSIMGVDLNTFAPKPEVRGVGSHGGYCGPAVKPIALNMVASIAGDSQLGVPISGIGGIQAWQDALEFLLLGARSVQVCTAVMHYGFRIVEHLKSGLEGWMREKGFSRIDQFMGLSVPKIKTWGDLDLNYKVVAEIDEGKCIHCGLCYIACEDGCHQSIQWDRVPTAQFVKTNDAASHMLRSGGHEVLAGSGADIVNVFSIKQDTCVGCNMCSLVCPVEGCITMREVETGKPPMTWNDYQDLLEAGKLEKIQPPEHV